MEFKKAIKTKSRLRLAIDGVSGSGKTFTALAIASGMGGPVALIDSEHGSASLYADRFEFDTVDLMEFQIENYIEALNAAAEAKYPIVIVDSTSHAWDALVERVDRIANSMTGGNTSFRAWAQGTPLQKQLIEALLNYPGHVIVTCRSKTEYSIDKDDKGKTTINKVGTAAVQRAGFEYEFTMAMTMDSSHIGRVTKDRTGKFQDKFITKPGKDFGQQLIAWLNEGAAPPTAPAKSFEQQCTDAMLEIGNVLDSEDFGKRVFTVEEKNAVREEMRKELARVPKNDFESKLGYINSVLEVQKLILHSRLEEPSDDATPTADQAAEAPASAPEESGAKANGEKPPCPPSDDGFVDDIPVMDESKKPGKKGTGKDNTPSLLDGYKKHMQNKGDKEPALAGADTKTELDIF